MSTQSPDGFNVPSPAGTQPSSPAPKKSNALWWILGIIALVLIGSTVLCCGGATWLGMAGMGMVAAEIQAQVADDPVIVEHIGNIEDMSMNLVEVSKHSKQGGRKIVFSIKGDKGEGLLIVPQPVDQGGSGKMVLEMPDGRQFPLEDLRQSPELDFSEPEILLPSADEQ